MPRQDRVHALIDRLYGAPGTADGWLRFLDDLCEAANASCAHFISVDPASQADVAATVRTDPMAVALYAEHWGAHDPWGHSARLHAARPGDVLLDDELIPRARFVETAYFQDFARHHDLVRGVIGTIEARPGISVLSVGGWARRSPFGTEDTVLVRALMPHLRRALQLHRRLAAVEAATDGVTFALDRVRHAVLLVAASGAVVYMNAAARELTALADGLSVDKGELRAARLDDTARLRRLIADASATGAGEGLRSGGALRLGRPSGRPAFVALVAPCPRARARSAGVESARTLVIVADPVTAPVPSPETLRVLFRLTAGEARLARLVAQGVSLDAAGRELGLRTSTLRTRLKTVFEKTGVRRQAELVRLFARLPG